MTRVATYARVSTDEQAEKYGLDVQRRRLNERAQEAASGPTEEFVDDGYSGATLERPALNRLRNAVRHGEIDTLLITEPDRLARDLLSMLLLERELAIRF